jgi:integrase
VGTRRTYSSAANSYIKLCNKAEVNPFQVISEEDLCVVCWLWVHSHKFTGLASWLSGIEEFNRQQQLPKLPRGVIFEANKRTMSTLFGQVDQVQRAHAITEEELASMIEQMDLHDEVQKAELECAMVFCFHGLFRAAECTRITMGDLQTTNSGLVVTVPFSKTNPAPATVALLAGGRCCPVKALCKLMRLRGHMATTEPLFRFGYTQLLAATKLLGERLGLTLTTHSFRRGGATHLFIRGLPEAFVKAHGRWISDEYRKYIDYSVVQSQLPEFLALITDQHRRG